ncbi:MAG TPA: hypothetical protein VFB06_37720 [Streptosporangiaceae bacterium]|nr:hypothetical protein [Streptosporangiaceae bacterium]
MAARKRESARKDVSCALCGKALELWDATTALDGRTVCASGCMGGFLGGLPAEERGPQMPERPDDPPPWADGRNYGSGSWYEDGDYGGAVDGLGNVSSDADPGL